MGSHASVKQSERAECLNGLIETSQIFGKIILLIFINKIIKLDSA